MKELWISHHAPPFWIRYNNTRILMIRIVGRTVRNGWTSIQCAIQCGCDDCAVVLRLKPHDYDPHIMKIKKHSHVNQYPSNKPMWLTSLPENLNLILYWYWLSVNSFKFAWRLKLYGLRSLSFYLCGFLYSPSLHKKLDQQQAYKILSSFSCFWKITDQIVDSNNCDSSWTCRIALPAFYV